MRVPPILRALLILTVAVASLSEKTRAQERFYTTPNRSGADGARQSTQLQQETNRGIVHQISITAIEGAVGNLQSRVGTAETNVGTLQTNVNNLTTRMGTAEGNISTLQSEMSNVKPHASAIMPGTCSQSGAKLRWNTTSNNWECVAEGDPTVRDFAKNDLPTCGSNQLLRSNGNGFTCVQAGSDYVAAELDPKIGATTSNKFCRGTGSQVVCDQDAPVAAESDPQVGAVTSGRWCRGDGTAIQCDQTEPSGGNGGSGYLPVGSVAYGGSYQILHSWDLQCRTVNPYTNACSCPIGFTARNYYRSFHNLPEESSNGSTSLWICEAPISSAAIPPTCTGSDKTLQWNGSAWSCNTIASGGGTLCQGQLLRITSPNSYGDQMTVSAILATRSPTPTPSVTIRASGSQTAQCDRGDGSGATYTCAMSMSCDLTATCNSNASWTFSRCVGTFTDTLGRGNSVNSVVSATPN